VVQTNSEKLGIKGGATVFVRGAASKDAARILGVPVTSIAPSGSSASIVVLFAADVDAVTNNARWAIESTDDPGRTWIAYRKGASRRGDRKEEQPLHRDTLQAALAELDLGGVILVSLDDEWSAMRVKRV
jgi:hypothetical protein